MTLPNISWYDPVILANGINPHTRTATRQRIDKIFVITGTLSSNRDEIREKIENCGGRVSESVSKKTNYLVLGENPGSKYEKALKLEITILKEEDLIKMFDE